MPGSTDPPRSTERPQRLLTFGSGGWVLLLAALIALGVIVWQVAIIVPTLSLRNAGMGDGETLTSYRFDLTTSLVPREQITPAVPIDRMLALDEPPTAPVGAVRDGEKLNDVRKLVSHDRVIGVIAGGEARCYPLWILEWHEVVNDVVGGVPLAITYCALTDSVVVFDRRVGEATLSFGVSGLLLNSNTLFYDRQPEHAGESLWAQLQFRAITGPAAGTALTIWPSRLTTWQAWRRDYPASTVIVPALERKRRYKMDAYTLYRGDQRLRYPVDPMPPAASPQPKTAVVAVGAPDARWTVLHVADLLASADPAGVARRTVAERELVFQVVENPPTAWLVQPDPLGEPDSDLRVIPAYWFAWYAQHGGE